MEKKVLQQDLDACLQWVWSVKVELRKVMWTAYGELVITHIHNTQIHGATIYLLDKIYRREK